jgi:hypothetical protein
VLSVENSVAKVSIHSSGVYTLMPAGLAAGSNVPLYIVFSLIFLAAVFMPFLVYFDKHSPYINVPAVSITNESKSDRGAKFATDFEYNGDRKTSVAADHLLLSLFFNAAHFTRSKKLLTFVSNVVLGICIQACLLKHTTLPAAAVGVVAALVILPVSAVVMTMFSREGKARNFVAICILLAMLIGSVVGVFITGMQSGWIVAFMAGLATEIFVSETIVMALRRIVS